MDEYNQNYNEGDGSMCDMLAIAKTADNSTSNPDTCTVVDSTDEVYINSIIVAVCTVLGIFIAGTLINKIGKKRLLIALYTITGSCALAMYWAKNSQTILGLSSVFITLSGLSNSCILSVMVELFPTHLRTMTVAVSMMFGRTGSLLGNVFFPVVLQMGCLPPFMLIGGIILLCAVLSLLLPSLNLAALE